MAIAGGEAPGGRAIADALRWLSTCGSTNDEARTLADEPGLLAVATDHQLSGRGRHGRVWYSPSGCGLYLSWLVGARVPPVQLGVLPLLAGLVTCQSCEELGAAPRLKWPNDILLGDRKLAGILGESRLEGERVWTIIGIGLNLRTPPGGYPPDVPAIALETPLPARAVAERLVAALEAALAALPPGDPFAGVLPGWLARGPAPGTRLRAGSWEGAFAGLATDGALLLDTPGGRRRITAGEVDEVRGACTGGLGRFPSP